MMNFKILLLLIFISGCSSNPSSPPQIVMTQEEYDEYYIQSYISGWEKAVREVKQCGIRPFTYGVANN